MTDRKRKLSDYWLENPGSGSLCHHVYSLMT